jgi:hypothetical protein
MEKLRERIFFLRSLLFALNQINIEKKEQQQKIKH